jgi:hypothetical protein
MKKSEQESTELYAKGMHRRKFLTMIGGTASVINIAAACTNDDILTPGSESVDLGSGDIGILNYAYALEQLEAAFYVQVIATPYVDITNEEKAYLTDIAYHEVAHREFFKKAIPDASRIIDLTPNFSSIDFTSRTSVLGTAKAFEDLSNPCRKNSFC